MQPNFKSTIDLYDNYEKYHYKGTYLIWHTQIQVRPLCNFWLYICFYRFVIAAFLCSKLYRLCFYYKIFNCFNFRQNFS